MEVKEIINPYLHEFNLLKLSYKNEEDFIESFDVFKDEDIDDYLSFSVSCRQKRQDLISEYGFAIPTEEALQFILNTMESFKLNHIVELGAGLGYWASLLKRMNYKLQIDCYDRKQNSYKLWFNIDKEYYPVLVGDESILLDKRYLSLNYALMLIWPPYYHESNPNLKNLQTKFDAYNMVKNYIGNYIFYIGEDGFEDFKNSCTGDQFFFTYLNEYFEIINCIKIANFPKINDKLFVLQRK